MKALALAVLLVATPCYAQKAPTCLVIRHASTARQFFVSGANWQYVAGDFPVGMKWKSNIRDRDIRKIKELGGRVIVIRPDYGPEDLVNAQKGCATP